MLWDNLHQIPFVDMILIEIYSGWRPQELAILKMKDVDIKAGTMRGGLKTEAGKKQNCSYSSTNKAVNRRPHPGSCCPAIKASV